MEKNCKYNCHGGTNQHWKIQKDDDDTYSFINVHTRRWIDVMDGYFSIGAELQQWEWNGSDAQKFYVRGVSKMDPNILNNCKVA
ncbi:MAG: RICIN domain-containing protein [Oscillospiraceae bacterium]|nr:RICIN domain-containing protein [Oscillospiraceae bacterium]